MSVVKRGREAPSRGSIMRGVVLALFLHFVCQTAAVLAAILFWGDTYLFLTLVFLFGLTQWVYFIPCGIYLHRRGAHETARGMWIIASLGFLASGACWGIAMFQFP